MPAHAFFVPAPAPAGARRCLSRSPWTAPPRPAPRRRAAALAGAARMVAVPDDAAVDMVTFALGGPGVFAALLFVGGLGALLYSFGEFGPRGRGGAAPTVVLLRVDLGAPTRLELSTGGVRALRAGESVLQFRTREECGAAARALQAAAAAAGVAFAYEIFTAGPAGVAQVSRGPNAPDAPGATRRSIGVVEGASDKDRAIAEYEQAGAEDDIDREWRQVVDKLAPIRFQVKDPCKLCGGAGTRRCARCGGASRGGKHFACHCDAGRVTCDWCQGSGRKV